MSESQNQITPYGLAPTQQQIYDEIQDGIFRCKRELSSFRDRVSSIIHNHNRERISKELQEIWDALENTSTYIKAQR